MIFVGFFGVHIIELSVDVLTQVCFLDTLPFILVQLDCVKCVLDLLGSELAVLSKRVQADDVLNLLR